MADIVIGVASSHTPQLSSGADLWSDHAERDRRNPQLLGKDARYHTYDELLAEADPELEKQLAPEVWEFLRASDDELLPYDVQGTLLHAERLHAVAGAGRHCPSDRGG